MISSLSLGSYDSVFATFTCANAFFAAAEDFSSASRNRAISLLGRSIRNSASASLVCRTFTM